MKRFLQALLITGLTAFLNIAPVHAADVPAAVINKIQKQAYYADPTYDSMARSALRDMNPYFSFTSFRRNYAMTRQYAPISDPVTEKMLNYTYIVETSEDAQQVQQALSDYNALVFKHLANVRVVMHALSQAKRDKRFGSAKALNWIRAGLLRDLFVSGDGMSLSGAYDVITMDEEIYLFKKLGLKNIETISNQESIVYYNMHEVEERRTGRTYTLFVNTTFPMKYLSALADVKKGRSFDIRRQ